MFDIHTKVLERDVFQYFLDLGDQRKAMRISILLFSAYYRT